MARTTERFDRLFKAARTLPPAERDAFLAAACSDDAALRRDLESLLQADAEAEDEAFLEAPAADWVLPPPEEAPSLEGRHVGPYRIERQLGRGGMGEVYLALREEPFKRYVALKVIRHGMDTREVLRRFDMERQILASLDHPNIARLLDGGRTEDGLPYLVMDYVEGVPIDAYCDRHKLPLSERIRLFQAVCAAIQYAHQNLVVHRDLKPSNILVTTAGEVKLLDFGIAKVLNPHLTPGDRPITRTNFRMMTPEYASPEQVRGEAITTTSDVYALGVLLYELLTGHRPYRLKQRMIHEIARIIVEEEPTRPSTVVTHVEETLNKGTLTPEVIGENRSLAVGQLKKRLRGDLDNIVMKALRKSPSYRYATVKELSEDLGRHLRGLPVLAQEGSTAYRMRKFVRRHRAGVATVSLVLLSLVGGLGVALWQARVAEHARIRAQEEAEQARQTAQYLEEVFGAADPANRRPGSLTARELLDRGVERIDEELDGQPALQAAMLTTLGRVYTRLHVFDTARVLLDRSLMLQEAQAGAARNVAQTYEGLALLHSSRDEFEDADSLFRLAGRLRSDEQGAASPALGGLYLNHAYALQRWGRHEAAQAMIQKVVGLYRDAYGADHPRTADALVHLVRARNRWHRSPGASTEATYQESVRLAEEALALLKRQLGERHLDVAGAYAQLATLYSGWGYMAPAPRRDSLYRLGDAMNRRNLAIIEAEIGRDNTEYIAALWRQANFLGKLGQKQQSVAIERDVYNAARSVYGDHHGMSAMYAHNLHLSLAEIGLLDSALVMARRALAIYQRLGYSTGVPYAARWYHVGVRAYALGRLDVACPAFREAQAIVDKTDEVSADWQARPQAGVGLCLAEAGRDAEAEPLLRDSYEALRGLPELSLLTLRPLLLETLVTLYRRQGRAEEAARYEALRLAQESRG